MARRLPNRIGTRYESKGKLFFGAAMPNEAVIRSVVSYVSQDDDDLIPTLTVRETVRFAAGLRLPTWMTKDEKNVRAESVLFELNLRECADTCIGDAKKKGVSQGEKRRVAIAVKLLTDPRILILDEPTSGLDSFTATSIIDILRDLAINGNRTVILSIHQARSDWFGYFDHILLIGRGGQPVYAGEGGSILHHFSTLGYHCPLTTNPADFLLDLITVNLQDPAKEAHTRNKVNALVSRWADQTIGKPSLHSEGSAAQIRSPAELGRLESTMTPLRIAFPILLQRSILSYRRSSQVIDARIAQVLGFTVIVTLFWAPLRLDYEGVQSRLGFVQQQMGE